MGTVLSMWTDGDQQLEEWTTADLQDVLQKVIAATLLNFECFGALMHGRPLQLAPLPIAFNLASVSSCT